MGKKFHRIRGLNAGQLARILVKQGHSKNVIKTKKKIHNENVRECAKFIQDSCYYLELAVIEGLSSHRLLCADVHALFSTMAKASPAYGQLLLDNIQDNVIDLILYCDEVTPGNVLAPDPSRKINAVYLAPTCGSICRQELTWATVTSIRQRCVKNIIGGMATVLNAFIQSFHQRNHLQVLECNGKQIPVTYRIRWVIADEAALHAMLGCKGAAGRKPCFRCSSLISKSCAKQLGPAGMGDKFQCIDCSSLLQIQSSTDDHIWEAIDLLATQKPVLTQQNFAEMERNIGWTYTPTSLQSNPNLRQCLPPSTFLFDALHCYFSQGILGCEVTLLLTFLKDEDFTLEILQQEVRRAASFFQSLHRPNCAALAPKYFTNEAWKANASTQIGLWPLIHYVLHVKLSAEQDIRLHDPLQSFNLLCEELKHIQILKHGNVGTALDVLERIQAKHQTMFCKTYGLDAMKPKHHFRLHLSSNFKQCKCHYDCLAMERKHRFIKSEIEASMSNLTNLDRSLTARLHLVQLEELTAFHYGKAVTSKGTMQWNALEIGLKTPLLLLKHQRILVPSRWKNTFHGIAVQGDVYDIQRQHTANITVWNLSQKDQRIFLEDPWMIPTYWRIVDRSLTTII